MSATWGRTWELIHGDCREVLAMMEPNSVHCCITDPPYHLTSNPDGSRGFMGKDWDGGSVSFQVETWKEVLRVLKPGGFLLVFSSCRTYHRMACAVEDAGFVIHPLMGMLGWIQGQGMPKGVDVEKSLKKRGYDSGGWSGWSYGLQAIKPSCEPLVCAFKPLTLPDEWGILVREINERWRELICRVSSVSDAEKCFTCLQALWRKGGEGFAQLNVGGEEGRRTALFAKHPSTPSRVAAVNTVLGSVPTLPGEVSTHQLGVEGESAQGTVTLKCGSQQGGIVWSIVSLWSSILDVLWSVMSRSTIEMVSGMITDLRILNLSLLQATYQSTMPVSVMNLNGEDSSVRIVDNILRSLLVKMQRSGQSSVQESATGIRVGTGNDQGVNFRVVPDMNPILCAQKPFDGKALDSILCHEVGAYNVNSCRIATTGHYSYPNGPGGNTFTVGKGPDGTRTEPTESNPLGRMPPNVLLVHAPGCLKVGVQKVKNTSGSVGGEEPSHTGDGPCYGEFNRVPFQRHGGADGIETVDQWECVEGCPVKALGEQSGESKTARIEKPSDCQGNTWGGTIQQHRGARGHSDEGTAARFFPQFETNAPPFKYCGKASFREKEAGLLGVVRCPVCGELSTTRHLDQRGVEQKCRRNIHPTVKPIELMRWLVRLVTRGDSDQLVVDPFCGSGSTGVAVVLEQGRRFVGIDQDAQAIEIADSRIRHWAGTVEDDLLGGQDHD